MKDELIIIGLDGGASKINGWNIILDSDTGLFKLGEINIWKEYKNYETYNPDFIPVDLKTQIAELDHPILTEAERKQASSYKQACADMLIEMLAHFSGKEVIIGIGMPGLKTKDKRGIAALANGPRIPDLSKFIEDQLKKEKIKLREAIAGIGSDADYCGIGEEYSEQGLFKDVENAYYIGGGTGVADALKLKGKLLAFDQVKSWISKSWEMKSRSGDSFEQHLSAKGIQEQYSKISKVEISELINNGVYLNEILEKAISGEEAALKCLKQSGQILASLIFERISTLYQGWQGNFAFINPKKKVDNLVHPYLGLLLERIVIGQRLGTLLEQDKKSQVIWPELLSTLSSLIKQSKEKELIDFFLSRDTFKKDIIRCSSLREGPAIGAGIDAFNHYKKSQDANRR